MDYKYDRLYIRPWGSSEQYQEFYYTIDGVNSMPEHDSNANDVDLDAYTNTAGYTVRNRVRQNVASINFNVPSMTGAELHHLIHHTSDVWLDCLFFYEPAWGFVSKKMYRSGTIKYHKKQPGKDFLVFTGCYCIVLFIISSVNYIVQRLHCILNKLRRSQELFRELQTFRLQNKPDSPVK